MNSPTVVNSPSSFTVIPTHNQIPYPMSSVIFDLGSTGLRLHQELGRLIYSSKADRACTENNETLRIAHHEVYRNLISGLVSKLGEGPTAVTQYIQSSPRFEQYGDLWQIIDSNDIDAINQICQEFLMALYLHLNPQLVRQRNTMMIDQYYCFLIDAGIDYLMIQYFAGDPI